jgi:hypothetical protein
MNRVALAGIIVMTVCFPLHAGKWDRDKQSEYGVEDAIAVARTFAAWNKDKVDVKGLEGSSVVYIPAGKLGATWRVTWSRPRSDKGKVIVSVFQDGGVRIDLPKPADSKSRK